MKKAGYIFIGMLMGIVLATAASAYADEIQSLIGKKIEGQVPVYLDGEKLDDAIIIENKSYAPVRKVAEAAGKEVTFAEGKILLESTKTSEVGSSEVDTVVDTAQPTRTVEQIDERIASIKANLAKKENQITLAKKNIELYEKVLQDPDSYSPEEVEYVNYWLPIEKEMLANYEASKRSLESELSALEAEKAALKSAE